MSIGRSVRLGDVAKVVSGYAFSSADFGESGIPVVKIANVRNGFVDLSETQFVSPEFLALDSKYHVRRGDILISLTGSHLTQPNSVVGRVALFRSQADICLLNQRAGKIIVRNPEICDSLFLFYSLSSPEKLRMIARLAHGAASQANVSPTQVESIELFLPATDTQRAIASILSAYDDLIENNTRRIKILEEMAQRLYREWFVNFRFPGHEKVPMVDSEMGPIPQGWHVKTLGDLADITMGQSPPSEFYNTSGLGLPFHQGVTDFGTRFPKDRTFCSVENRLAEPQDTLVSVRAPVGRLNIALKKMVIGRGLCAIRSKFGEQAILFQQLKDHFREEDSMGSGTIFKAVTKQDVYGIKLMQADHQTGAKLESWLRPVFRQLEVLAAKNNNLRATRDLLLPKLISGEVSVENIAAETEVEALA